MVFKPYFQGAIYSAIHAASQGRSWSGTCCWLSSFIFSPVLGSRDGEQGERRAEGEAHSKILPFSQIKPCWHSGLKDLEVDIESKKAPMLTLLTVCKSIKLNEFQFFQNFYKLVITMFFFWYLHAPWILHLLNKDVFLGHQSWKYMLTLLF